MSDTRVLPLPASSTLFVVDLQERLVPAMSAADQAGVIKAAGNLIALWAPDQGSGGDVLFSEQYPRGLGPTVPAIQAELALVPGARRIEKTSFSVCADPSYDHAERPVQRDVVLVGMETHVCVLLTGLDLLQRGHRVFVPHDAVASRTERNRDNGLALLSKEGAVIVNSETLIFNALGQAGGDRFKRFSARIR